ncbi:MAG TPA: zinc ribbon domain-containing protein [Candidatus Bathyarchaeia archaeon]|nr:zinc ribbon domain-containing protein [Candidatus Bathyarchaeia archaeon]
MVEHRCPVCGKPVLPNFKFCKSCGARIPTDLFHEKKENKSEMHTTSFGTTPMESSSTSSFEPIDREIVQSLAMKGRLINIDKDMDEILEEIENLEERVKVGLIPKEDAKDRVNELNKRFVELKLEKKQLKKQGAPIPIFEMMEKKDLAKERLSKLEGLKNDKSITEKTYDKMKNEYQSSILEADKQITHELIKMERWQGQLNKELAEKRELLETLFVRKSTGELSEDEYNRERDELTEDIKDWEAAYEELKKTLKKLK